MVPRPMVRQEGDIFPTQFIFIGLIFFKLTETSKHCLPLIPYWIKMESVLTRKSSFIAPVEFGRLWPILFFAIWGLKLGIMTDLGGTGVGPLYL